MKSIYFYDYETWGLDPIKDRPAQFAGIRTDLELNIIDEPLVIYNKPSHDFLPSPLACLITGITPQHAELNGVTEDKFASIINRQMSVPGTVITGYNSAKFDDVFSRFLFYRNFYDPYAHEWKNNNSRLDILSVARACYALRPEGINWPRHPCGRISFRLEDIAKANGITHEAHNALSDVKALIEVARLIKRKQPKLFSYFLCKKPILHLKKCLTGTTPFIYISSILSPHTRHVGIAAPLAYHSQNKNMVICLSLSHKYSDLEKSKKPNEQNSKVSVDEQASQLTEDLYAFTINIKHSPFIAPFSALNNDEVSNLNIDMGHCLENYEKIKLLIIILKV